MVEVTLPATPPVQSQKSIGFSTLYVATLSPTAARPTRDRAFYTRANSSDWEVFGRFARSAIRGTPSPTMHADLRCILERR